MAKPPPLSLSPKKLLSTNGELPTPAPTPDPSKLSGLSVLSSAPALHCHCADAPPIITSSASLFLQQSMDNVSSRSSDPFEAPKRRCSISHKVVLSWPQLQSSLPQPTIVPQ